MQQVTALPRELDYVLLLFVLFVLPRFLQRYRLPRGITAVAMGIAAGVGFGWFAQDRTVGLLATLGIVSLFLFAGLEVDFPDLRRGLRVLVQHVLIGLAMVALVAPLVRWYLDLAWRPAVLVALALLTPSTGFILDSLATLEISERERFWVKSKAVATELERSAGRAQARGGGAAGRGRGRARPRWATGSRPAWSKWRWLIRTTAMLPGSTPAARSAGATGSPS